MGDLQALKAAFSERRLDDAWALYRQLDATDGACAEVHLAGAQVGVAREDFLAARWAIEKAAGSNPSGNLLGKVRFMHGFVLSRLGDVSAAIEQIQAYIAGTNDYPELGPLFLGPAWLNLGVLLRQAKKYRQAIDAYETACSICRQEGLTNYLCTALQNLAWTSCFLGEVDRARSALDESESLCTTQLRWHQKIGEAYLLSLGPSEEQRQAMDLCGQLIQHPETPSEVRSHAYWVSGRVALNLGQLEAAEDLAKQAVHHGSHVKSATRCLRDAAELLRSVREVRVLSEQAGS